MRTSVIYLRNDLRSGIARFDALHERIIRYAIQQSGHETDYASVSLAEMFGFPVDDDLATARYAHLDDGVLSSELSARLRQDGQLWIIHEAPPSVIDVLGRHGQSYLEFRLSPIRFANDLILALTTNDGDIGQRIRRDGVSRTEAMATADLVRLRSKLRDPSPQFGHLDGAALVVGQVDFDLSLIDRKTGRRLELTLYSDELREAVGRRSVFYKPHPYAAPPAIARDRAFLRAVFEAEIGIVQDNIYDLFCGTHDLLFIGVSSGVLQEADLFGLSVHYLHEPFVPLDLLEHPSEAKARSYVQTPYAVFADPLAWRFWLGGAEPAAVRAPMHLQPRDLLRELYRNSWGFWPHWDEQEMRDHDIAQARPNANWAFSTMSFANFARLMRGAFGDSGVMTGSWSWFTGWEVHFREDAVFTVNGEEAGRYVFFGGRALVLYYRAPGLQDFLWLSPDGRSLSGFNSNGVAVTASRR